MLWLTETMMNEDDYSSWPTGAQDIRLLIKFYYRFSSAGYRNARKSDRSLEVATSAFLRVVGTVTVRPQHSGVSDE